MKYRVATVIVQTKYTLLITGPNLNPECSSSLGSQ